MQTSMAARNKIVEPYGNYQLQSTPQGKYEVWKVEGSFDQRQAAMDFIDGTLPPDLTAGILGWHFIDRSLVLAHGDGRQVKAGETVHVDPPIVPMQHGLLVSTRPIVAMKYGRRPIVCRVLAHGEMVAGTDGQFACTDRTCLWLTDATLTVIQWAGWCATRALDNLKARGLFVDPRSDAAAQTAIAYVGTTPDIQVCMAASQAAFIMGHPPEVLAGAMAANQAIAAAQMASRMSSFQMNAFPGGTGQFPQAFPQQPPWGQPATTGGPTPFQIQTPILNIGSMDFAVSAAEGAGEQAARAFPDYQAERDVQNEELEKRLLQLEPQDGQQTA